MSLLPKAPKLHHVGVIQPDLEAAEAYAALFGQEEEYRGYVEPFECWCIFLKCPPGGTAVELVVPTGGPLAKFNRGAGGLHHYAFETPDLAGLMAEFAARDVRMLEETPVKGAGNFLCNFVHPISTRGVIVEYIQPL
ncbi:MAG: VOC family protein [Pseudomonadota bacterium]